LDIGLWTLDSALDVGRVLR